MRATGSKPRQPRQKWSTPKGQMETHAGANTRSTVGIVKVRHGKLTRIARWRPFTVSASAALRAALPTAAISTLLPGALRRIAVAAAAAAVALAALRALLAVAAVRATATTAVAAGLVTAGVPAVLPGALGRVAMAAAAAAAAVALAATVIRALLPVALLWPAVLSTLAATALLRMRVLQTVAVVVAAQLLLAEAGAARAVRPALGGSIQARAARLFSACMKLHRGHCCVAGLPQLPRAPGCTFQPAA